MMISCNVQTMTGAKVIINTLSSLGIDTIFGYPGGIVLDLYDELYNQNLIRHILMRHEQSAVHAAEGYARVTGKCGVVLVTSGPGATNTVTGIVNAYLDGYPLIVLTGQVTKDLIGKDAFQEANICDITKSCTKAVFQITNADDIQKTILKAYKIAMTGKKGPVLIDMAKNIFVQETKYNNLNKDFDKFYLPVINTFTAKRIYNMINNSNKPVLLLGGGTNHSKCYNEIKQFIHNFNIPIVSTMMGLGAIETNNKNYLGMVGIFGSNSANYVLKKSDLIISLGARLNDRITCVFKNNELNNKIIQVNINPAEESGTVPYKEYLSFDAGDFLAQINKLSKSDFCKNFDNWRNEANEFQRLNILPQKHTNMLHSFEIMQHLQEFTKDKDVIFTCEVGQHQLWAVKNLEFNPDRKILVSGGSGTMGFGIPAAIGAAVANPNKTIVCITGDGSMQMSLGELSVCKDYNLNIKILILDNGYLGMVRQLQEKNFGQRYSQTKISNPNFVELAESFGINAQKVRITDDINKALDEAFSNKQTSIIDFVIEPMETL